MKEFESWIAAIADKLAGLPLQDGRKGIKPGTAALDESQRETKRGAKEWLKKRLSAGYTETIDQPALTELLIEHLDTLRERMRSFRRLEHAIEQLITAARNGRFIITPAIAEQPDEETNE